MAVANRIGIELRHARQRRCRDAAAAASVGEVRARCGTPGVPKLKPANVWRLGDFSAPRVLDVISMRPPGDHPRRDAWSRSNWLRFAQRDGGVVVARTGVDVAVIVDTGFHGEVCRR